MVFKESPGPVSWRQLSAKIFSPDSESSHHSAYTFGLSGNSFDVSSWVSESRRQLGFNDTTFDGGVPITQAGLHAALRASPFVTCADLTAELDARFCAHCEQFNKDLKGLSTTISTNINRLTQDMPDLILEHLGASTKGISTATLREREVAAQEEQLCLDRMKEERLARQEAQANADRHASEMAQDAFDNAWNAAAAAAGNDGQPSNTAPADTTNQDVPSTHNHTDFHGRQISREPASPIRTHPANYRPHRCSPEPTRPFSPPERPRFSSPYTDKLLRGNSPFSGQNGKHYRKYLCYTDGIEYAKDLDEEFLIELGFGIDVIPEIQYGTFTILDLFDEPNINPKYISTIHKLDEITPSSFLDWYTYFIEDVRRSNIALVPFDAVVPKYAFMMLRFPGLGERRYLKMAGPLFTALEYALPKHHPVVKEYTMTLNGMNHDGFWLLYSVMSRNLPVFCLSIACVPPTWTEYPNVSQIAKEWLVYFSFMAKQGVYYAPMKKSNLYIKSLADPSLISRTLQASVDSWTFLLLELMNLRMSSPSYRTISPPKACSQS